MEPVDADRDELAVDKLDVVGKGGIPVENEDLFGISIIFIIRLDLILWIPLYLCSDWLHARVKWAYLECSGFPVFVLQN